MRRLFGPGTSISLRTRLLLILIPMFAAATVLKIVFSFIPPPRPDMVPDSEGLLTSQTVEEAQPHTVMPITLPSDTLGSEVFSVGVYTEGSDALPVGSAIVTFVKNDQRFVELIERPDTTREDVVGRYGVDPEDVALYGKLGSFLTLPSQNLRCVSTNEKWNLPGFCEIRRVLAFEREGVVYTLAADGTHATDGELLTLARDIIRAVDPAAATVPATETFSLEKAGIASDFDAREDDLAYLDGLKKRDGTWYATIDPVTFVDCATVREDDGTLPADCQNPGDPTTAMVPFVIADDDPTTTEYPLADDAGPYFLATMSGEPAWRTLDRETLAQVLSGSLPPEAWSAWSSEYFYDFHPVPEEQIPGTANVFHAVVENGIVTKLVQKYMP